jgi:hypothetical protein
MMQNWRLAARPKLALSRGGCPEHQQKKQNIKHLAQLNSACLIGISFVMIMCSATTQKSNVAAPLGTDGQIKHNN